MTEILQVGLIHSDPRIIPRMQNLFEREAPSTIAVESFRRKNTRIRMQRDEIRAKLDDAVKQKWGEQTFERFRHYIENVFHQEVFESERHKATHRVPVYCIDDPFGLINPDGQDVFDAEPEAVRQYTSGIIREKIDEQYHWLDNVLKGVLPHEERAFLNKKRANELRNLRGEKRDVHPAKELRRLYGEEEDDGKIVYLCGGMHAFDDEQGETVYSMIKDLNVRRVTLWEYE